MRMISTVMPGKAAVNVRPTLAESSPQATTAVMLCRRTPPASRTYFPWLQKGATIRAIARASETKGERSHHAGRRLPSHRQQWLADLDHLAALQTLVRSQPRGDGEGRALRDGIRAVDDQAARVRRAFGVLGLQSGKLHADGGPRRRHQPHPVVRDLLGADAAAADRRAHGGDDRQHLARPLRPQHDHRLAGERVFADGHLARRAAPPAPLRLLRRIRDDHARVVGDRTQRFPGRVLPDGGLPLPADADRPHTDHLRRPERPWDRVRGDLCRLQFLLQLRHQRSRTLSRRAPHGWSRPMPAPAGTVARWS